MSELPGIKELIAMKKAGLDDFGMEMEEQEPPYTEDDYLRDLQYIQGQDGKNKWYLKDKIRWDTQPRIGAPLKDRQFWAQSTIRDIEDARDLARKRAQEYGTRQSRGM